MYILSYSEDEWHKVIEKVYFEIKFEPHSLFPL